MPTGNRQAWRSGTAPLPIQICVAYFAFLFVIIRWWRQAEIYAHLAIEPLGNFRVRVDCLCAALLLVVPSAAGLSGLRHCRPDGTTFQPLDAA